MATQPKVKVEIAFDDDFLSADLDQDTLQQLVAQVNRLVESGVITGAGVYDIDGNALDIDAADLREQIGETAQSRWLH